MARVEAAPPEPDALRRVRAVSVDVDVPSTRFVRAVARPWVRLPDWHAGAGRPAWIFVDEFVVEGEAHRPTDDEGTTP